MPLFVLKIAAPALVMVVVVQLARFKNLPWVLVLLAVLVARLHAADQPRRVRPPHLRRRRQPAGRDAVRRQGQVGDVLDLRQHGRARRIAGVIFAGRLNQAGPTAGTSFELDAIAAAFIGGAAVQGGVGKVVGAITGGLIMAVINNGMSLIGAPSERVMLVKGLVLLAAVAFDVWSKRRGGSGIAMTDPSVGHPGPGAAPAGTDLIELGGSALQVGVVALGARLAVLRAPDRDGTFADVVLGLDPDGYRDDRAFLGATVGRFANRIDGGTFVLDGRRHTVPCNENGVALHGGPDGFDRQVFAADPVVAARTDRVRPPWGAPARTGRTASPARSTSRSPTPSAAPSCASSTRPPRTRRPWST